MTDFTREEVIDIAHKLVGANLRWADLTGAHLSDAKNNADTTWPEGFDPVAAGAVLVED
jgi:uncharacterized protein YjbI with pentapeptide repeats